MQRELISEFEARRVERMLRELYAGKLRRDETLRVLGGSVHGGWLSVTWELANSGRSFVYPVEVRVDLASQGLRERQAVDLLYDFLGAQFDAFLSADREQFSGPNWEEVEFAGKKLFTRGQFLSEAAELAADSLIGGGKS